MPKMYDYDLVVVAEAGTFPQSGKKPPSRHAPRPPVVRCSFCGKKANQVNGLVEGLGGIYICNVCIEDCQRVLAETSGKQGPIAESANK